MSSKKLVGRINDEPASRTNEQRLAATKVVGRVNNEFDQNVDSEIVSYKQETGVINNEIKRPSNKQKTPVSAAHIIGRIYNEPR